MKSKELSELVAGKGLELKSQQTLKPEEFEVLFETVTLGNQITNIEDYLDGITYIPSKKKQAETPAPAKEEKAEPVAPIAKEPKAEVAPKETVATPAPAATVERVEKTEKAVPVKAEKPTAAPAAKKPEAAATPKAPATRPSAPQGQRNVPSGNRFATQGGAPRQGQPSANAQGQRAPFAPRQGQQGEIGRAHV